MSYLDRYITGNHGHKHPDNYINGTERCCQCEGEAAGFFDKKNWCENCLIEYYMPEIIKATGQTEFSALDVSYNGKDSSSYVYINCRWEKGGHLFEADLDLDQLLKEK